MDGYRFAVAFWWVFLVGWVSLYCCLSVGVPGRFGIALLLSFIVCLVGWVSLYFCLLVGVSG